MDETAREYIARRSVEAVQKEEIIYEVSECFGLDWKKAERLVLDIQNSINATGDMTRRQLPMLSLPGIFFMLLGVGIAAHGTGYLNVMLLPYANGHVPFYSLFDAPHRIVNRSWFFGGEIALGMAILWSIYKSTPQVWLQGH